MVDFTTFSDNPNDARFEKTMQSTLILGGRRIVLSNRGLPKEPVFSEIPSPELFCYMDNNTNASIFYTNGGLVPAVSFIGDWKSNSSHALTYFEFDNSAWAGEEAP